MNFPQYEGDSFLLESPFIHDGWVASQTLPVLELKLRLRKLGVFTSWI